MSPDPQPYVPAARGAARSIEQHLHPDQPTRRILSLDGGGIRGIASLQYLRKIERELRERFGRSDYALADYFDLIGGTSTGAIIATALALGKDVDAIEVMYRDLGTKIFSKSWTRDGVVRPLYDHAELVRSLKTAFGADTTFGSPRLRTGLMVMTKRFDSGSPWPLSNHPKGKYFLPRQGQKRIGTSNMLLWEVVRASTAAPHFFAPEVLEIGHSPDAEAGGLKPEHGQFVDGGVSTANNPSFQLLKTALIDGYGFGWKPGSERLFLLSVGTGLKNRNRGFAEGVGATAGAFAMQALTSIMDDCNREVETIMQWLSDSPTARVLDREMGSLEGEHLGPQPLVSYVRYNFFFDAKWWKETYGVDDQQTRLDLLEKMDEPGNMDALAAIAGAAAGRQFDPRHLPAAFDP